MILGINVNLIIQVVVGLAILYGLILLAVAIFGGFSRAGTMLKYTAKFWWVIVIIVGFIIVYISLTSKKKDINTKIKDLEKIENKTKEDEKELHRLEQEKKKTEEEIQRITDEYKKKLEDLKKKEPKPGDAGRSSDDMNNAWR